MAKPVAYTDQPAIDWAEVAKHNTKEDCWVVLHGHVWELGSFLAEHPGGANIIVKFAGFDGTKAFQPMHPRDITDTLPKECYKGPINPDSPMTDEQKAGPGKKKEEKKGPALDDEAGQIQAWFAAVKKKTQAQKDAENGEDESKELMAWWLAVKKKTQSQRSVVLPIAVSSKL